MNTKDLIVPKRHILSLATWFDTLHHVHPIQQFVVPKNSKPARCLIRLDYVMQNPSARETNRLYLTLALGEYFQSKKVVTEEVYFFMNFFIPLTTKKLLLCVDSC